MAQGSSKLKVILISIVVVVVWFLLLGVRLIDYFSSINENGLRETVCGTQGCNDIVFLLSTTWTFSLFIIIPLIIPLTLVIYWGLKKKRV